MSIRILIAGANGQVGTSLQSYLSNSPHLSIPLNRQELDITKASAVLASVSHLKPDVIVNTAAYTAVDKAESDVEYARMVNTEGAKNLAAAASSIGIPIIHLSTDYVFDGEKRTPYSEDDEPSPQSVYGATKLAGEQAVVEGNKKHIILRTSWVFGEHGNNFVKTMLRLGTTRSSLNVVDDQHGAPTYAGDIAAAIVSIAEQICTQDKTTWGTYHYSGFPYVTWCGFAKTIFSNAQKNGLIAAHRPQIVPIKTDAYPTIAKRPADSCLNCEKIKAVFGIEPSNWAGAIADLTSYIER